MVAVNANRICARGCKVCRFSLTAVHAFITAGNSLGSREHTAASVRLRGPRNLTGADADAFVFVSPEGAHLDYSHWRRRVWLPACKRAGLRGLTFHDLRRAAATALVLENVDLKTAQTRLGHSDPRLTLGLYAQASSEADRHATSRVGERFIPDAWDGRGIEREATS
jgi:integrase